MITTLDHLEAFMAESNKKVNVTDVAWALKKRKKKKERERDKESDSLRIANLQRENLLGKRNSCGKLGRTYFIP